MKEREKRGGDGHEEKVKRRGGPPFKLFICENGSLGKSSAQDETRPSLCRCTGRFHLSVGAREKIVFEGKFSIDEGDCLHSTCEHFLKCGEGWRKVQIMKRSYVIALSLVLMRSGITCLFERDFMHALKKCEYRFEQSLKYLQRKMCTPLKLTMNELSLVKAQFRKESSEIRSLEENIATLMQKGDASACVEKISELIARREELVEINSKLALAQGKANELLCKKKQQMEKKLHPACAD